MPLTRKGSVLLQKLQERYGQKRGTSILYAGENKGTFTGIHHARGAGGHHSPPTPAELNAHKELAKEVAGGLRKFSFRK